jgi:hypothetical protein
MGSNVGLQVDNSHYSSGGGGAGVVSMSDGTSLLVSLKTALRYKGGHGRIYMPGIDTSVTAGDGRNMSATPLATLNTQLGVLQTTLNGISSANGGPYVWIVWHRKLHSAPNTTEVVLTPLAQQVLATQRRRLRKVPRRRTRA